MKNRTLIAVAAVLLMIGVGTGAFGAHGLRAHVAPNMLAVWQTAVLYQLVHALGLMAVAALRAQLHPPLASASVAFLLAGVVLFSGSLYGLVLFGTRGIGVITPIGGVSFMMGWLLLAISAWKGNRQGPNHVA